MKLNINKMYVLYTTSDYIANKQLKVLGMLGYDRVQQYRTYVENVAINEKLIVDTGNTDEYLKKQIFYDCIEVVYNGGKYEPTGDHIILWDDIIDSERTQVLYEDYIYKLSFNFRNLKDGEFISKHDVIESINRHIHDTFGNKVKFNIEEIYDSMLNNTDYQLSESKKTLNEAVETIKSFIELQDSAKKITENFTDNNIIEKTDKLVSQTEEILKNTEEIIRNTR